MNTAAAASLTDFLAVFGTNLDKLTAERDALTDAERVVYVVTCAGLPIDIGNNAATGLSKATRFDALREATFYANRTRNGLGERGRVQTLGSAYNDAIDNVVNVIATIKSANKVA